MFVSKMYKIFFQNLGNLEKIKTDVDKPLLVLITKNNVPVHFAKIALYFIFGTKSSLSTSVFIFSTISQILKTKFYVVWTQTCKKLTLIKFANLMLWKFSLMSRFRIKLEL